MRKMTPLVMFISMFLTSPYVMAKMHCDSESLAKTPQHTLSCYIAEQEDIHQKAWKLISKSYDAQRKLQIETYNLASQHWPKSSAMQSNLWQHDFIIYKPDQVKTTQALLFINGGTRHTSPDGNNPPIYPLDFGRIAAETHSIVIDLHDVPNQYLVFEDNILRKEDGIVAHTWNRYLDDTVNNRYWPLHLPMTKAVIKTMDAVQQILEEENKLAVSHFVVSGASKRGWTAWLAALVDKRINAIVPIVIDILNTKENMQLIYTTYNNNWPIALHDYVEQKTVDRMHSPGFDNLLRIQDPIAYLDCDDCQTYRKHLTKPKYIISASGDDFFVPDSLKLYLDKLPGETLVRVVPNQSHLIHPKIVEAALLSYYQTILLKETRPSLQWMADSAGRLWHVSTNTKPLSVKLWEAVNPENRDFRLASHINYVSKDITGTCVSNHSQYPACQYPITISLPEKGFKSHFVEVVFQMPNGELLTLTTPAYVIGG